MAPPDATATCGDGNDDAASDPMQKAEKVATMGHQQQQLAVTTQKKKPKKRKKKLKPSSSPAVAHQQQQQRRDSEGSSIGHMQQQRGRPRVVWDVELHGAFLRAYNALGPDAVPKKILAMMNVQGVIQGVSRANVASHLQKHRLNLKREQQSIHDKRERGSITEKGKRDKRTPLAAPTNLPIHPYLDFPMVQPIQHCFTPPLEATVPMVQTIQQCFTPPDLEAIIATMPQKLVEEQGAGRDATALLQAAAAAASGYNPIQACQDVSVTGGGVLLCQAVSMTGEQGSVPEAEICVAQLQMAPNAEEVQGAAAQPGAAEMAAKAEEGQAGSMDPPGSSVVHAYWEIDDTELSWDFGFFP